MDGEPMQLQGIAQQLLKLTCSQKGLAFSQATLLSAVTEACVKHGAFHVPRMRCGELAIFEVDFMSSKSLHAFLSALDNGQFESSLSHLLTKKINGVATVSAPSTADTADFSIISNLFLLMFNSKGGSSKLREPEVVHTTLANHQQCFKTVQEGELFNYGALFRSFDQRAEQGIRLFSRTAGETSFIGWRRLFCNKVETRSEAANIHREFWS